MKEKKAKSELSFGIQVGVNIIAYSWALLIIPALLIQAIGVEHNSNTYMLIMSIFQIIAGFLSTSIAIKNTLKSSYLINNNIKKAMITGIASASLFAIIDCYILGGLLPIIPFNNLLGLIILIVDYSISHFYFKKLYLN